MEMEQSSFLLNIVVWIKMKIYNVKLKLKYSDVTCAHHMTSIYLFKTLKLKKKIKSNIKISNRNSSEK